MRWLVFFLIVLNGLVYTWLSFERNQSAQVQQQDVQAFDFNKVARLQLKSELGDAALAGRDKRQAGEAPQEPLHCGLLGPFPELISVRQARNRLQKQGLSLQVIKQSKPMPVAFWVYISAQSSKEKSLSLVKKLQADQFDSFLETDPAFANSISLGFFADKEAADQQLQMLQERGYVARQMSRVRSSESFWLRLREGDAIADDVLLQMQEETPLLKKQEKDCDAVAILKAIE